MERDRRPSAHTILLLAALIERAKTWKYGYELSYVTGLKSGTIYPILMRLSDRGLLESTWRSSPQRGRPPRHMYRLTTEGTVFARNEVVRGKTKKKLGELLGGIA